MTPEGQAKAGDVGRTPDGALLEIVSIVRASELVDCLSAQSLHMNTPNFLWHSSAATCALYGQTEGREHRNWILERKRLNKPVRRLDRAIEDLVLQTKESK